MIGFYPIVGDILHAGHILAIEEAATHCDTLIVALNCKPENKSPVQSIFERWTQLSAVKYIDRLIPYEGKADLELICKSIPHDIRFVGDDYRDKEFDGKQIELDRGVEIYYLNRAHGLSSTELKHRIRAQDMKAPSHERVVTISDLKEYFTSIDGTIGDEVVYRVVHGDYVNNHVEYAYTFLNSGNVNGEYYMTKGHTHIKTDTPEIYTCINGSGLLITIDKNGEKQVRDFLSGVTLVVPDGSFHRVINTGDEMLIFVSVYDPDAGHDYNDSYRNMNTVCTV